MAKNEKSVVRTTSNQVVRIIFIALLCDLMAFTMPLPLFPRLINDFVSKEALVASSTPTILSHTLSFVRSIRQTLLSYSTSSISSASTEHWDLTLLGGLLASVFSLCQFVVSPRLGALSDRHGRRKVLLISMMGNLVSAVLWLTANTFGKFVLSRLAGGLSEGNVQLSILCISDVTTSANRSKSLAMVGIAFAVAFTVGPSIGAFLASRVIGTGSRINVMGKEIQLNGYAVPALATVVLLVVETTYLYLYLPETKNWTVDGEEKVEVAKASDAKPRTIEQRMARLATLEWIHFGFLFFFSGAEFTLTFLTYNLFSYSNVQNGKLLGFIGILSALLQGGYVRRQTTTVQGPYTLAVRGITTCCLSLILLALLPQLSTTRYAFWILYSAATGLAFVSATVVNSLNSLASLECTLPNIPGAKGKGINKGQALGSFRSRGQLGRALGPLLATSVYFIKGPGIAYGMCAVGIAGVAYKMSKVAREAKLEAGKGKKSA